MKTVEWIKKGSLFYYHTLANDPDILIECGWHPTDREGMKEYKKMWVSEIDQITFTMRAEP